MIIVLDTNFLIYMIKHRIADQVKELGGKIVVPSSVVAELRKPTLGVKAKAFGAAALELIKVWNVKIIETDVWNVDKSVIEIAKKLKKGSNAVYVATADKKLIDELSKAGIKNISLKRGKIVALS